MTEVKGEPDVKKARNGEDIDDTPTKPLAELKGLSDFVFKEVLSSMPEKKVIFVLCHNTVEDKPGILLLNKKPYPENETDLNECIKKLQLNHISDNDIYLSADAVLPEKFSLDKTIFIYPATEKHVTKYRSQPIHQIFETPDDYKNITLPYIESSQFNIDWVYNILDGKKEQDTILFKDDDPENGFYLMKDLKWDGKTVEDLYYQAIIVRRDLKSVRDLTDKELPLLENILKESLKAIKDKHGVPESRLKIHFHYQPTYYHLHVHFRHIGSEASVPYVFLQSAISNIKLISDYYQRATLQFIVKEGTPLYEKYVEAGRV